MLHLPVLRKGEPYRSLDVARVAHHRTGEPLVEVSQANTGLIARDLRDSESARARLAALSCRELLDVCVRAADHFASDDLPLGNDLQSPQDYVEQVSATTGLPYVMARNNLQKIRGVLAQMEQVLDGLTRNLDLKILDEGFGVVDGHAVSYFPRSNSLGVVLPSNSPGVHSLWAPAIALKIPLVLKPGSAEPWTPYRMAQAFIRAGCPREAFGYYPGGHSAGVEILRTCGRGMVFGDVSSTQMWQGDPRIELHGPGYSKIVIGQDRIDEWQNHLDVMVDSILENGGRSCINASGIWVPSRADEIAGALAERLAAVVPRPADDERAQLAPFADPSVASRISDLIDRGLAEPGARDATASARGVPRLATLDNCNYLLPTVVRCERHDHPLANREFLFPFASVVEVDANAIPEILGPSLVVTAITADTALIERLLASPLVGRLNLGAIRTTRVSWDQPHEGNLFDHLYCRRAFQMSAGAIPA